MHCSGNTERVTNIYSGTNLLRPDKNTMYIHMTLINITLHPSVSWSHFSMVLGIKKQCRDLSQYIGHSVFMNG